LISLARDNGSTVVVVLLLLPLLLLLLLLSPPPVPKTPLYSNPWAPKAREAKALKRTVPASMPPAMGILTPDAVFRGGCKWLMFK
jgi:hypothetical protein